MTQRESIAQAVSEKMAYYDTCPNEREAILSIILDKPISMAIQCKDCQCETCYTRNTIHSLNEEKLRDTLHAILLDLLNKRGVFDFDILETCTDDLIDVIKKQGGLVHA